MLVGYMRVSTSGDRQVLDLQRDALLAAGVDERHLGRTERRVGKPQRIETPPHPARGIQEGRMMFMFRPVMRTRRPVG
jgi:hypothetical protein